MTPSDIPDLVALGPEHRALLAGRLAALPCPPCDLDPPNLAIWRDCENPSFAVVHGNLCIRLAPPAGTFGRRWCLPKFRLSRVASAWI